MFSRLAFLLMVTSYVACFAQERIPHAQDKPPGPALSPAEAMAKMVVPEGFSVELVASEPDIINPVAMTIDERGRFWITESIEYPRRDAGPGKDRVKILEDTNGDGKADKFTVFMEGLNIPSGIAVGHGGVWIANSPDILFVQDTDGDGKADTSEVVVTGFGRFDTHELPNSLTWGPDGWLYGLNGVFNPAQVTYGPKNPNYRLKKVSGTLETPASSLERQVPESSRHLFQDEPRQQWSFTCAMFRIHPKTREFQVFCEGTSNPWGIAFNDEGDAFISACVIDHLWHLTETGYYHRQGGPYPPFTWKIESIVSHKHQKAAYCGIHWYDSDAYPEQYRKKLYMGNIHGSCINSDRIERFESTYNAFPEEDLLSANDAWFMPVVQKTGPDGCLYILDWYDRYHCYQDANRDPAGIDRLKGRLYRLRYKDTPRAKPEDMAALDDDELIARLVSANGYHRDMAQQLLTERLLSVSVSPGNNERLKDRLKTVVLSGGLAEAHRRAFGVLKGANIFSEELMADSLESTDGNLLAWTVRAAGDSPNISDQVSKLIFNLRHHPLPEVRLQVAIAATKQKTIPTIPTLVAVLAQAGEDPLAPRIVWQNLYLLLEAQTSEFVAEIERLPRPLAASVVDLLPRAADRILSTSKPDTGAVASYVRLLVKSESTEEAANRCLELLTTRVRSGELTGDVLLQIRTQLERTLVDTMNQKGIRPTLEPSIELGATLRIPHAIDRAKALAAKSKDDSVRLRFINALITAEVDDALGMAIVVLDNSTESDARRRAIQAIGRIHSPPATAALLERLPMLPADVQPTAIETLTDRTDSATALLNQVADAKLAASVINANQAQKMLSLRDSKLAELVSKHWGVVRTERDPARLELISRMRNELRTTHGDPVAGRVVFKKVCGQCHKIYGEGAEVGPDITRNGRASFEQLLSNVFDPSLVIGASYQALTVVTNEGRVVSGLPIEDSPQRVVLKVQGDKQEIIARSDIEEVVPSKLSLMPEGLEKQIQPQEMHDLFAYITLDKPPEDADARRLVGSQIVPGESDMSEAFPALIEQLLPGYSTSKSGEGGVAVLANYSDRPALQTHPVSRTEPCRLTTTTTLPIAAKVQLRLSVAAHNQGDWQLAVIVNGKSRHQSIIKRNGNKVEWRNVVVDLSDLAGQSVSIELQNKANDWANEFGYWNAAEIVAE